MVELVIDPPGNDQFQEVGPYVLSSVKLKQPPVHNVVCSALIVAVGIAAGASYHWAIKFIGPPSAIV